ncbi:MAG: hypothetical protein OEV40_08440 [Acidimicrobiia bacterium]|nr:hypothetical protein [Acidimicrobiia bacterium]
MIARHSAAAISGLLIWWLVVESLVTVFVNERYSRFLPFIAGNRMLGFNDDEATVELLFIRTENALIFGSYAALALAAGTVLLHRLEAK